MIITKTYKTIKEYLKANHTTDELDSLIAKQLATYGEAIIPTQVIKIDENGYVIVHEMTEDETLAYLEEEIKADYQRSINRQLINKGVKYENTSSTNENSDNIAKDIKKTGTFQNESTSNRIKDITTESNITNKSDTSAGTTTQNESNATRNNTDTSSSVNKFNDTPQGRLSDVKSGEYLTDARVIDDNKSSDETATSKGKELVTGKTVNVGSGNETGTSNEKNQDKDNEKGNNSNSEIGTVTRTNNTTTTGTNTTGETGNISKSEELTTNRQYVEEVLGVKDKSQSELLMKYRDSFINIDMMIIKELGQIFDSRLYIQDYLPQSFDNETDWGDLF